MKQSAKPPDARRLAAQARQQAMAARREFDYPAALDAAQEAAQWLSDVRKVAARMRRQRRMFWQSEGLK